ATYIGPGFTVGFAAKGVSMGYLFLGFASLFTLQTILSAKWLAPALRRQTDCFTIGDVLGKRFNKSAHVVSGVVSFVLCGGFVGAVAKAGGVLLHETTGISVAAGVLAITTVGVLYCYTGGLKAVVVTDALQFLIFSGAIAMLAIFAVRSAGWDLTALDTYAWKQSSISWQSMSFVQIIGMALSFLLGETLIPPYANRALSAESSRAASSGFYLAAGYSLIWFPLVIGIGIAAGVTNHAKAPDAALLATAKAVLPHGAYGILVVALVAIVMSTKEGLINAAAVAFAKDVWSPLVCRQHPGELLTVSKVATLVVGIVAAAVGLYAPSILDALLIMYSLWAPTVLPVLVMSLILPSPHRQAATPAMIAGGSASIVWQFVLSEPLGVPSILPGLAFNLFTFLAVTKFIKQPH
ncbi:MAG: sodium:solute symporter, partial [Bacteroidota bacterium]